MKTSTSHSLCSDDDDDDENENGESQQEHEPLHIDANRNENYLIKADSYCRRRIPQVLDDYDDDCDSLTDGDSDDDGSGGGDVEERKQIGEGSSEFDSFLVTASSAQRHELKTAGYVDV